MDESYVLGVASILSLLDAQAQLLSANLAVANSIYDFLEARDRCGESSCRSFRFSSQKPR